MLHSKSLHTHQIIAIIKNIIIIFGLVKKFIWAFHIMLWKNLNEHFGH